MKTKSLIIAYALTVPMLAAAPAMADDRVYADFPVTVKGYAGSKTSSVSYSGQIARHVLHDSLKKLASSANGRETAKSLQSYFGGKDTGRAIIAPTSNGLFLIKQSDVDQISKAKNLAGKTYNGTVSGMPNNMTGAELVGFWIAKAADAEKGVDLDNGYNYPQLISKFIIGAVFYNQVVDVYLDENLSAAKKPNDQPYSKGAAHTGKEHSWDEAFGYFGAPAHAMRLTADQVVKIAKRDAKALVAADLNGDGKVDLKSEMTFAPAYYAAGFDASSDGKTSYLHTITKAFLDGREIITAAKGEKLNDSQRAALRDHAAVIAKNWEKVFAEAVFKYAGSTYKDMLKLQAVMEANGDISKSYRNYLKHWGELKGFSLALQTGKNNLGETATRMNRMIGFGPLLPNTSQVVDIDREGNYVRDQGSSWGDYMLHMLKVQQLMIKQFDVTARNNDMTAELSALSKALGSSASAEND